MAHYMPPPMLAMFAPRPPLEYLEPAPAKRSRPLTGLAAYKDKFKDPTELEPLVKHETAPEKRARRSKKRQDKASKRVLVQSKKWNPHENENATDDAYKTLFVARLDYSVTEEDLKKEMATSGPVKSVKIIKDAKTGKPRGYAFIEFQDEKDLKHAYKAQDGKKVKDRRILVDVERGRTVPNWKPRRLGGGLGSTRKGDKKKKGAGAPAPPRREETSRPDRRASSDFRKEPPRDRDRDRDRVRDRERERDRYRDDGHRDDRHRDDRYRERERERDRDRDYRGRERERDRDRERPRSYREPSSRSYRDRDDRRDQRRPPPGLPTNGPPLPPQSAIF